MALEIENMEKPEYVYLHNLLGLTESYVEEHEEDYTRDYDRTSSSTLLTRTKDAAKSRTAKRLADIANNLSGEREFEPFTESSRDSKEEEYGDFTFYHDGRYYVIEGEEGEWKFGNRAIPNIKHVMKYIDRNDAMGEYGLDQAISEAYSSAAGSTSAEGIEVFMEDGKLHRKTAQDLKTLIESEFGKLSSVEKNRESEKAQG